MSERDNLERDYMKYVYPVDYQPEGYTYEQVVKMLDDYDDAMLESEIATARAKLDQSEALALKYDYKEEITKANSFQDIMQVFNILFPGTEGKHHMLVELQDTVLSAVVVMQDASATPEAQYDAMQKLDGVASYKLDQVLRLAGKTDLDIDKLTHQMKTSIPVKMLDSYILTAQDMTVRLNSVKGKEAEYRDLNIEINRIQSEILAKYEPERQAAEKQWSDMMDSEYNPWQKEWGYGRWQNTTTSGYLKKFLPWSPESVAEFQQEYSTQYTYWQKRLSELREQQHPYIAKRNEEFEAATGDMQKRMEALKAELEQAKQQAYDSVIDSILAKSPVTEEQAAEWSKNNVIFDKSAMTKSAKGGYNKKDIERDVLLFYRLTGGRLPRLEFTTTRKARSAAAHWSGELFIGHNFGRRTLWHEMAHLLEDDPKIKAAAMAFRDRRRDDAQLHRLRDLVPGSNYDPNEVAYKDSWLDPYIGKDYGQTATEVISMGMQQLASVPMLFELHEKTLNTWRLCWGCAPQPR